MKTIFRKKSVIICTAVLAAAILVGGFFLIQALMDPYDCRIVEGVSIGGMDVGGMTRREAKKALQSAVQETLYLQPLTVELPEGTVTLSPELLQPELDIRKAVKAAYQIGRAEGTDASSPCDIGLLPYLQIDEEYIRSQLTDYADRYDTNLTESTYQMEGTMPALSTESYDDAACQTLVVTIGIPTVHLDVDSACECILAELNQAIGECLAGTYGITVDTPAASVPDAPDLEAIYEEFYIAPVDDSLDMETYQFVNGTYGYQFDMEQAQELIASAAYGETVSIPMEYVEPEILGEEVYFRDVLGHCETKHNDNENRNTNLRLLCEALNGVILQPGEEFSYNETVGERTTERGYLPAPAFSGQALTSSIGGGVCQGSTTLYNCVLLADLEVLFRAGHGALVSSVPLGLDAAVNWGTTDFQFRNNFHFPIMIQAEVSDGYVKMQILGTDEKDYYIEMTSSTYREGDVIYAVSRKCKYDKETGELISRDVEARSSYDTSIG